VTPLWDLRLGDCLDRFWSKVDRGGDCWLWTACRTVDGYGTFRFGGKIHKAHRLSWFFANGEIPSGSLVCHHCDIPACVRPSHLFLGTDKDNAIDRDAKGRGARRDRHPRAKLTAAIVDQIRRRVAGGEMQKTIAAEFRVATSTIARIVTGERWAS
jgi:HNH endonuclease